MTETVALGSEVLQFPPFPRLAEPLLHEALPAWLARFAAPLQIAPALLMFRPDEARFMSDPGWWRHPTRLVIDRLAERTGLAPDALCGMTFEEWQPDPADRLADRFSRGRVQAGRQATHHSNQYRVCPDCLNADPLPYVRKTWTLGWLAVCVEHGTELAASCSGCRGGFSFPPMRSNQARRPAAPHCRCQSEVPSIARLAAHPSAVRLQTALMEGRARMRFAWPSLGTVSWPAAIALIDVILGTLWIGSRFEWRQRCFAVVERDLGLERRLTHRNHDGLLLAAWVLEQWPERLCALARDLRVAEPARQLVLWEPMEAAVRAEVQWLLVPNASAGCTKQPGL